MRTETTVAELEAAYADCVNRRGPEEAQDILRVMAKAETVADVPEAKRFLTVAALERRPPQDRAEQSPPNRAANSITRVHLALAAIRDRAFARGK